MLLTETEQTWVELRMQVNFWKAQHARTVKRETKLKENFALAKIPTNNFLANQFYFHLLLLAYNIINWFKRICLSSGFRNSTLETIRTEFLVMPAKLVKTGNRNTLKIPAEYISKQTVDHIIRKIKEMKPL